MNTALIVSLLAILFSIFAGWKFKINTGIVAMALAFIIGTTMCGLSVSKIIAFWPNSIVFYLISIGLFFNYAVENGTLDLLGKKMLYAMGGNAKLLPWVILLVATIVAILGAGPSTAAIVGPLAFSVAISSGISPGLIAIYLVMASYFGADNPFNGYGGMISMGLIEQVGYADEAFAMSLKVWGLSCIRGVIVCIVAYIVFKGYKTQKIVMDKPEDFNEVQRKTLALILIAFVLMVVPTILATYVGGPTLKAISKVCQPQSIMVIMAVLAALMKLADERKVIKRTNFNTIITIVGINFLLSVATTAGLVETMGSIASSGHFPKVLVLPLFALFGGFLSFFSSGAGVVCPLLYPLGAAVCEAMGIAPTAMFASIYTGAMATSISPYSTGGAVNIAACQDPAGQDYLQNAQMVFALAILALTMVLALVGVYNI